MNAKVIENYSRLRPSLFYLPLLILTAIALILFLQDALSVNSYIQIQKEYFFFLNSKLSQYPGIEYNLTQLGDAMIFLSILSAFIIYAPKMWESLISVSLISLIITNSLKEFFSVPRPAAAFDTRSFFIIGQKLPGQSSLPSGHSITVFTILTVLLFSFMPENRNNKILWTFFVITTGIFLGITRVAVGAHYPLDVLIGSVLGYMTGLAGIFISRQYEIWAWIGNKKYYPFFILLLSICGISLVRRIIGENLPIFYLALATLVFSLYKMIDVYVKK